MIRYSIILFLAIFSFTLSAQDSTKIAVKFTTEPIKVDGALDEAVWEKAENISNFWQFFPVDSVRAKYQTIIRMLYDEHTLYIGIRAEVPGNKYVVSSLRRDFSGGGNDNVTLVFDTFKDGSNAFLFGITPYGVQRDALLSGGGANTSGFNTTWDTRWKVESHMYNDHYILEVAIPFSSIKFPQGATSWRFQGYRWDLQSNEQSAWARVPQNQPLSSLAFMGELVFEKPLGKSRTPIAIIPYINALTQNDFETSKTENKFKVGGDAKIALGNSMNLDMTLNPDFSNVEVDNIYTNLTRFELFLPEKRQFFIDNSDLFGSFGSSLDAIPFFSRRIGLAKDTLENLIENRIMGGARLSGNLGQNWRLGLLDVQTDEDLNNKIASNNNVMLALQRKVFSRSNISVFFINRQTFKDYSFQKKEDIYNRVIGIDYNLASKNNDWTGKFFVHKSFQPGDNKGNLSTESTLSYNTRNYSLVTDFVYVDADFRSDLGFIPRKDFFKRGNLASYSFYPKNGILNTHKFQFLSIIYRVPSLNLKKTDQDIILSWNAQFNDQSTLIVQFANHYIFLLGEFDPTRSIGGIPLSGNRGYTFNQVTTTYQSNMGKVLSFNATSTVGQFFNGHNVSASGQLSLRIQPWALMSLALNYDAIRLPDPHPDADLWLLSPKVDITFSKSLFWSTMVQYSNQRDNLGINSRLQWRFAPLSDLYLVYNDNYNTNDFTPRFRSLNLKLTYWLSI